MTNRLIHESSPYLLQHAQNPVDWYAWGEEAFKRAKAENKPIFLSVGYAACHWCHVMAHESFEDPDTAALMNDWFINIKVDREERPDVDSIYMDAVVALTGQGGWPMSVFLTPDMAPFYGGTYFPPTHRHNMPSFAEVLEQISTLWLEDPDRIQNIGYGLTNRLQPANSNQTDKSTWDEDSQKVALEVLFQRYDWKHGGWGGPPKFPQPGVIEALINIHQREGNTLARDLGLHALDSMASGGMYDQIGGGFHRYAVDTDWLVPHFEKMLYDNACLLPAYLHAWQISDRERYLQIVEQTYEFLIREMRSPEGAFYASLDADSEGLEGKYYVWDLEQIEIVLGEKGLVMLATQAFDLSTDGNFEGRNVLSFHQDYDKLGGQLKLEKEALAQQLNLVRERLLAAREERIRPATDDKVITGWNGLLLTALAQGAGGIGRADMLKTAQQLAEFLLDHMIVGGELMRTWRAGQTGTHAFLEDHASLALGLLALYGIDFQNRWYRAAIWLASQILEHFQDPAGGFFDTPLRQTALITRPKTIQDTPIPSGSSMATKLMLQLHALTGEDTYRISAVSALESMVNTTKQHPTAFAGWLDAFEYAHRSPLQLAIVGDPQSEGFQQLLRVASSRVIPDLVRAGGLPGDPESPALMEARTLIAGQATAYLCRGFSCDLPTSDPEQLVRQIEAVRSD